MRIRTQWLLAWGLLVLPTTATARAADPISPEQFAAVQALVKPAEGEDKWAQIPWMTDLWAARQQAAAEGKPILLWEMDGHPLGCT
jgi:hypothetical protein